MKMMSTGLTVMVLMLAMAAARAEEKPPIVGWEQAREYVGEKVTVEGPVVAAAYMERIGGKPTFLNIGKPHPEPGRFTVVIWGKHRDKFDSPPEKLYDGKKLRVTGKVKMHKDNPEIEVASPDQIEIVE